MVERPSGLLDLLVRLRLPPLPEQLVAVVGLMVPLEGQQVGALLCDCEPDGDRRELRFLRWEPCEGGDDFTVVAMVEHVIKLRNGEATVSG